MAIAFVQAKSANSNGAVSITTPAMTSVSGHFLATTVSDASRTISGSPVTDSNTNTWTNAWAVNSGSAHGGLYYSLNITGGAGHTVTFTPPGGSDACAIAVSEFSGIKTSSALSQVASQSSAAAPHDSGSITTTIPAEQLLIGSGSVGNQQTLPPASVGLFNDVVSLNGTSAEGIIFAYAIVDKIDQYAFEYTYDNGGSDREGGGIATFKGTNIAYVQSKSAQATSVASVTTPAMASTDGNFLAAGGSLFAKSFSGSPITDSPGNTWSNAWVQNTGASGHAGSYYAPNIIGNASHTVTLTPPGGNDFCAIAVGEFSGIDTTSPLDRTATASTTAEPRSSGLTALTSQANELLIGNGSQSHLTNKAYSTINGDWTDAVALRHVIGGVMGVIQSYRIIQAPGTYNYQFSTGVTTAEAAGIAAFEVAVATSTGGGTTPSATDPAAGTSLCGSTVPLFYCILQKDSGSVSYSWVDQPLNEAAVQRQPRIVNVSKLKREMSDWSGRMVISSGSVTLTDYDGAIRALIVANTIIRKQIDFYMIDEVTWRASGTAFRVNQSLVTDYTVNADMTVTLQFEDRFGGESLRDLLSKPLPFRTLDTNFNADLPTQMIGKGEPIPYGLLSDETYGFPTVQVFYTGPRVMPDASTWYEGLIAGCGTSPPLSVWGADGVSVDSAGNPLQVKLDASLYDSDIAMPGQGTVWSGFYSTTNYRVVNSRRYMLMYFKVGSAVGEAFKLFSESNGSQGVPVHINTGGIEDVGDSTGDVIDSLPREWQHLMTNFVEQNHVTDADWYSIPDTANASPYSIINATSVETVKTRSAVRLSGGYLGAFVVGHDLERKPLGDWLQRICLGGDFDMFVDRHGRACLSMEDPTASVVKAFTITNVLQDTYKTWKDRSKLANDITCFTFKNLTQTNSSVTLRDSSPLQPTEWLTAKRTGIAEDSTSITALGGDPVGRRTFHYEDWVTRDVLLNTSGSVQAHRLARSKNGPDYHQVETDLCGLDVELGDIFSITHFAGKVSTTRNVRCTAIELEPPDPFSKRWAVTLTGYDVTDLVS